MCKVCMKVLLLTFIIRVTTLKVFDSMASKIPGEILAMKHRFFSFRLAPQILSRGCETKI